MQDRGAIEPVIVAILPAQGIHGGESAVDREKLRGAEDISAKGLIQYSAGDQIVSHHLAQVPIARRGGFRPNAAGIACKQRTKLKIGANELPGRYRQVVLGA